MATIPIYFLFKTSPKEITAPAITTFGIIIGLFLSIIIFTLIYNKYKGMNEEININKENINEIKKHLNFKELFSNMDVRLKVLEKLLNKKGYLDIDPRWIMLALMAVLLILFLRQMGVI